MIWLSEKWLQGLDGLGNRNNACGILLLKIMYEKISRRASSASKSRFSSDRLDSTDFVVGLETIAHTKVGYAYSSKHEAGLKFKAQRTI